MKVEVFALSNISAKELEEDWLELESRSDQSIFLTWSWINTWLNGTKSANPKWLIKATSPKGQTLGLGIFCQFELKKLKVVKLKQLHLHRTGVERLDQIWPEYNDFLLDKSSADSVRKAMWRFVTEDNPFQADQWVASLSSLDIAKNLMQNLTQVNSKLENITPGFIINNKDLNPELNYPSLISKSSYKQINKTSKLLKKEGTLDFFVVKESQEQISIFRNFHSWHINKWQDTSTPSGFTNHNFRAFHESLIKQPKANTLITGLKLKGNIIGWNYYLITESNVYFYLSSLKPHADNKIKLGLLLHKESANYLLNSGFQFYDFLAGDTVYKRKLSTQEVKFADLIISTQKFKSNLYNLMVNLKQKIVSTK